MGIFSDSSEEDIQAIGYFVYESLGVYARENEKRAGSADYEITPNDRFDYISEAGSRILQILALENPVITLNSPIIRAAILVVLCNAAPPFSLRRHGRICLDFPARKDFLSRFTCLLVHAALSTMEADRGNDTYMLAWNAFLDETFREQFLMYLQWIDGVKVDPGQSEKEKKRSQEAYLKILAHISLGCALALSRCVKEVPIIRPHQLPP